MPKVNAKEEHIFSRPFNGKVYLKSLPLHKVSLLAFGWKMDIVFNIVKFNAKHAPILFEKIVLLVLAIIQRTYKASVSSIIYHSIFHILSVFW